MDKNKIESPHCDDSDNKINVGALTETPFNKNQINVDESNNEINNIQKPFWFNKLFNIAKLKNFIILLLTIVLLIFILIITLMGLYIKNLKKEINKFITKKMIISIQDINTIEKEDNLKIIIGIYFGSSISGYYILQNNNISSKISSLFPSDLILDKDSKRGLFYGDKAFEIDKNQYIFEKQLYFSNFKKYLSSNRNNNYNTLVKSSYPENDKVLLKTVITQYFDLIKEDIFEKYNFSLKETKWMFTVSGLLDENGKQYMKNIIDKIGIIDFDIILEQEAASLNIFYEFYNDTKYKKYFKQNSSFIVVNLGHTSVDICVNKIIDDNFNLIQLLPPKSYDIKSDIINEKIIEVIETVYGKEDGGKKYKKEKFNDWQITLNDIEKKKNEIDEYTNDNIGILIPFNKDKSKLLGKDEWDGLYKDQKITYDKKYIYIPSKIIKSFVSDTVFEIINILDNNINRIGIIDEKIDLIILTGAFSNSKILQNNINKRYKQSHLILFSKFPNESIMRGAAIYGLMPNKILYRVSPVTIGIGIYEKKEGKCLNQTINDDKEIVCYTIKTFIKMGEIIKNNNIITHKIIPWNREKIKLFVYSTFEKELSLNNGKKIWEIKYELNRPNSFSNNIDIKVSMKFSNYITLSIMDSKNNYKNNYKSSIFYYF